MTAKVISNDGVNVKLGFKDGTFRTVAQSELGFLAPEGMFVDVYEQNSDGKIEYAYVKSNGSFESGFGQKISEEFHGKHVVNKVAYILLALFFGGLGVHKFFAKKYILGVIYLVFCWTFIPSLVAFIEAIIAITKTADNFGNISV